MSKRLQTVQQSVSGLPEPLVNQPFNPVIAKRDPTVGDTGFPLGQTWLNKISQQYFVLVGVAGGGATWQNVGSGGGSVQFAPDTGANVSPVAGVVSIDGFGGIETLNGGAGILQVEDRRWLSAFVVDPSSVVGQRGTFTTIQSAINAASAGNVIFVRPGTYVEDLTLKPNVDLVGIDAEGRAPGVDITIIGVHMLNGNGISILENFVLSAPMGNIFTITGGPAQNPVLGIKNSVVDSPIGMVAQLIGGGGQPALVAIDSNMSANGIGMSVSDGFVLLDDCSLSSNTLEAISLSGNSSIRLINWTNIFGSTSAITINSVGSTGYAQDCLIRSSNDATIKFTANGFFNSVNNNYECNSGAGFYISGIGNYSYAGDVLSGGASGIDPLTTQTPYKWRPYATAGTSGTSIRGTSGFDDTDFAVTDGFVTLANAGGAVITSFTAPLDVTVLNNKIDLYTVPVGKTFYITSLMSQIVTVVGFVSGPQYDAGTTPGYSDLFVNVSSGAASTVDEIFYFSYQDFNSQGPSGNGILSYPAGATIGLTVSSAAVAGSMTIKFLLQGFLK